MRSGSQERVSSAHSRRPQLYRKSSDCTHLTDKTSKAQEAQVTSSSRPPQGHKTETDEPTPTDSRAQGPAPKACGRESSPGGGSELAVDETAPETPSSHRELRNLPEPARWLPKARFQGSFSEGRRTPTLGVVDRRGDLHKHRYLRVRTPLRGEGREGAHSVHRVHSRCSATTCGMNGDSRYSTASRAEGAAGITQVTPARVEASVPGTPPPRGSGQGRTRSSGCGQAGRVGTLSPSPSPGTSGAPVGDVQPLRPPLQSQGEAGEAGLLQPRPGGGRARNRSPRATPSTAPRPGRPSRPAPPMAWHSVRRGGRGPGPGG